ncbi:MAG: signal peptidase II [Eubacteriales bacterium]|nr:signal peptidase II [Eubacteriales bacterium]
MPYIILTILILIGDQGTKWLVRRYLLPGASVSVIRGILKIQLVYNPGAAFGIFSGRTFLNFIPIAVAAVFFIYIFRNKNAHPFLKAALTMIAAGGIGNLIDRLLFHQVTDMISFSFFPPVFNGADICVTLGCAMVFLYALLSDRMAGRTGKRRKK